MSDEVRELNLEGAIFERRKFIRIKGSFVISYSDISSVQAKSDISQTKDVSLGGILFTTDRKFEVGTILRIKLKLPESPDYLKVKVKVVGSRERAKNILYETRVRFISIREEDKDSIAKLVEYNLRNR